MLHFNSCCCCFSLRAGSLILLWIVLITECPNVITNLLYLYTVKNSPTAPDALAIVIASQSIIVGVIGVLVSFLGIYGIRKHAPGYLNGSIYYNFYYAIILTVFLIASMTNPSLAAYFFVFKADEAKDERTRLMITIYSVSVFLVAIVLHIYFALILRSYRDAMKEEHEETEEA